jgi:membrane-bound lytic murein transglycosylase A
MTIQKSTYDCLKKLAAGLLLFILAGCPGPKPVVPPISEEPLIRLNPSQYPEFSDDLNYEALDSAILKSLSYLNRIPPDRAFRFGTDDYTTTHLIKTLEDFKQVIDSRPNSTTLRRILQNRYRIYKAAGRKETRDVLFTGYFEPLLEGRRHRDEIFKYPVYGYPKDMVSVDLSQFSAQLKGKKIVGRWNGRTFVPYYDRHDIDFKGRIKGNAEVIVWLKDPIDVFFLHIQGSGKILLKNGRTLNVHYHGSNGRPYRSIGRYLIEAGIIDRASMSMSAIREYLKANPKEIEKVFSYNPSYVFFKFETEGPKGALGVVLTPGRSVATDANLFPKAALAYVETEKPVAGGDDRILRWIPMNRFVLNQDTGGAIKGAGRVDLFWGRGRYAEIAAGHMKQPGRLYFLVLEP